ncbi:alpha/beta fold hydrolase [Sphingomonas sp.]|uniref:alpha/beta hydrolase n=1 Tax=Sphingomonas sp. TaxID=28214 RepID=UPI0025EBCDEF|nr:alpha/beta fold hydrolase [Sphingomonas sp.]
MKARWPIAFLFLAAWSANGPARSPRLTLTSSAAAPADKPGIQTLSDYAYFYRPIGAASGPRPLLVLLHGAGLSASGFIDGARAEADRCGCLLLAVQSKGATWDTIRLATRPAFDGATNVYRMFGTDTGRIEAALSTALRAGDADAQSVVLVGFSDGASYALSLGLANQSIFRGVVAIAPGFYVEPPSTGAKQRLFIAHSPADRILPFERTRDDIVTPLKRAGFDLRFRQFEGGHTVIPSVLAEGVDYALDRTAAAD